VYQRRGARAILIREAAEFVALVLILAAISRFVSVPAWVWIGFPTGKVVVSIAVYAVFLRKTLGTPAVGVESLVGERATTLTCLDPCGQVRVRGEIWSARSATRDTIPAEHDVTICDVRKNTLRVVAADGPAQCAAENRPISHNGRSERATRLR